GILQEIRSTRKDEHTCNKPLATMLKSTLREQKQKEQQPLSSLASASSILSEERILADSLQLAIA
ncbi:hypothetical protein NDU88_000149, partial [Pleurodeles waltl]